MTNQLLDSLRQKADEGRWHDIMRVAQNLTPDDMGTNREAEQLCQLFALSYCAVGRDPAGRMQACLWAERAAECTSDEETRVFTYVVQSNVAFSRGDHATIVHLLAPLQLPASSQYLFHRNQNLALGYLGLSQPELALPYVEIAKRHVNDNPRTAACRAASITLVDGETLAKLGRYQDALRVLCTVLGGPFDGVKCMLRAEVYYDLMELACESQQAERLGRKVAWEALDARRICNIHATSAVATSVANGRATLALLKWYNRNRDWERLFFYLHKLETEHPPLYIVEQARSMATLIGGGIQYEGSLENHVVYCGPH